MCFLGNPTVDQEVSETFSYDMNSEWPLVGHTAKINLKISNMKGMGEIIF